ncbi:hypothetical protein D3C75_1233200 [compost metagenome]
MLLFQFLICIFHLLGFLPHGAGNPIPLPEAVDDSTADPPGGVGFKLQSAQVIKLFHSVYEPQNTIAVQVFLGHIPGQSDG